MTEIERLLSEGFINEAFLKEEVKCEYTVSSEMKKAWAVQLDLLVKLFEVCKRNNLRVWAYGGTVLGAVRHKGFIPWDDDSDVVLPREDYEKLIKLPPEEFPAPYFLQSEFSDAPNNPYTPHARFLNSNTTVDEHVCDKNRVTWNSGVFVDIFPLDGISRSKIKLFFQTKLIKLFVVIHHTYILDIHNTFIRRLVIKFINSPLVHYNSFLAIRRINKIARWTDYEKSGDVGMILSPGYDLKKLIYNKTFWDKTVWIPFENIQIPVPSEYKKMLEIMYGDYMKYPPKEKRGNWHSIEFKTDTPYSEYYRKSK